MSNSALFGDAPIGKTLPDIGSVQPFLDQWHGIQFGNNFKAITESPVTPYAVHAAEFAGAGALVGGLPGVTIGYGVGASFGPIVGTFAEALTRGGIKAAPIAAELPMAMAWGLGRGLAWRGALVGLAAYGAFEAAKWTYNELTA